MQMVERATATSDLLLSGQRALVVGGGGLGSAIAVALARQGCDVAVSGRGVDRLQELARTIEAAGTTRAVAVRMDLHEPASIAGAVNVASDALGGLDILINAAGQTVDGGFEQTRLADWRSSFEVKLFGTLEVIRAALPHLKRSRGTVLTLTGLYGREPNPEQIISGAINAALANSHKALAADVAADGVQVLSLCIGGFLTDRLREIVAAGARAQGRSFDEQLRLEQLRLPLGRFGQPQELGEIVALLAAPRCRYLTGVTVTIDGGAAHGL